MSNTFDFKRFGQVLVKDWKNYFRNFGISLIVWSCIPILFWIVTLISDINMDNDTRASIIASLVFSVLLFVPSKVFGNANLSREGVSFAMLPATNLEKFLSMVLYCSILTPLIVGLGSWAIDSLLYLLPFGGFTYFFVALPKSKLGLLIIVLVKTFGKAEPGVDNHVFHSFPMQQCELLLQKGHGARHDVGLVFGCGATFCRLRHE